MTFFYQQSVDAHDSIDAPGVQRRGGFERRTISEDILATLDRIAPHAGALGSTRALAEIATLARSQKNDAAWLRGIVAQERSLHEAVRQQCLLWRA